LKKIVFALGAIIVFALGAVACGGDDDNKSSGHGCPRRDEDDVRQHEDRYPQGD
jgi:hypothetical protein